MKLKDIKAEHVTRDEKTGKWFVRGLPSEPVYEDILRKLKKQIPFSLSRYGDGEWACIMGKQGSNCDDHSYFPDMGAELKQAVFSEPEYMMGLQPLTMSHYRNEVIELAGDLDIDWVNSDVLHDANITEHLKRFFEALKGQPVIMIAPERLQKVPFSYSRFIEIPLINCWTERDRVVKELLTLLPKVDYAVLLFCASMSTNVMIHDLYKYYGKQVTMIDAGSVFDIHCGFETRSYHKKMRIQQ